MYRCVSFRTPEHVRKEWAEEHGLPLFTSDQYTHAMDAVCKRLGVSEGASPGPGPATATAPALHTTALIDVCCQSAIAEPAAACRLCIGLAALLKLPVVFVTTNSNARLLH